ncbi:putative F-box protein At1g32420 [Benincasa hispida]|uniref:putative F-box protein At1g32420 n=1 Tax=Benincasa hispida TaxID=102211 RepID=UPI00190209EF|nr:putative F-box protein At1g32420 [Benincasa hispida]
MAEEHNNPLTDDITIEILQHFSLRSLAVANCVSKLWQSFISTKSLLHTPLSPPIRHGFFFQSSHIPKNGVPIHFFPSSPTSLNKTHFPNLRLLASSNGLLLCGKPNQNPIIHYSVFNPSTNQLIPIPKPTNLIAAVKIGFHSHNSVAFTILRFVNFGIRPMEIFTSETGEWRRLCFDLVIDSLFLPFEGPSAAVLNGVFYWLEFDSFIYAFDLLRNEFFEMEFPTEETEYRRNALSRCLAVTGGRLLMASTDGEFVEIRVLQDRDCSWGLKCRLSVETLVGINANTLCATAAAADRRKFIGIVGFQGRDSERIYLNTTEVVICCDIETGKVEIVHRFDASLGCTDVSNFRFFPYESL